MMKAECLKGHFDCEVCVSEEVLCGCVHTYAVTRASASIPCGACLSFNPESPDIAMLKSEVYSILIMVYYIFPTNIISFKRRVNVFKNKFVSFFIFIVLNVQKGSSVSMVIVPFNVKSFV